MRLSTEYCIIGSGFAGGIVACELLKGGVKEVVMVEAGAPVLMRDRRKWYEYVSTGVKPYKHTYDLRSEYTNAGSCAYPLRASRMWARGGTLRWTGHSFRMKPEDFFLKTNTGKGVDWPITYDDLEQYYTLAEVTLQVAGEAQDAGRPPRSGPFPLPAFPYASSDRVYLQAMDDLGISYQHNCISRNSRSINCAPKCRTVGTCEYCPEGARFTGDQLIDYIDTMPDFTILTSTSGLRLRFARKSRAHSLEVFVQPTGELGVIEAEKFIVCCGGIESPKLLLASSNRYWEYGVGNDLGYVGKFFTEHPGITCTGLLESFIRSPETESLYNTACSRHFDSYEHQSTGKFLIEVIDVRDYDLAARIEEGMSFEEIEKDIASGLPLALGALIESIPRKENSVQLGKGKNRFFIPNTSIDFSLDTTTMESMKHAHAVLSQILTKIGCHHVSSTLSLWWARHHMGTCRMAKDPSAGVVDENLRVHDTENVYVCSSAVFPTCGSANPTLTIAALAHRLGRHLVNSDASAHTEMSKLEERTD